MLYQIVKPLARWIIGMNFRRIYLSGVEKLPAKGPIILASNHPTAFIEPCVLASFQNRPLYFLVRGDFFRKKIFSFLLNVLHMIPIFRMKDGGFSKIKNNFDSFERCYGALAEGKALMILAEGFCIHEKRLRPIRKGTARIAFGAFEKEGLEQLQIFPVGVNYTDSDRFRSDLMIAIGTPIFLKDHLENYANEKQERHRQLTEAISQGMSELVVHVDHDEDLEVVEKIWQLWRNDHLAPQGETYTDNNKRLQIEKSISDQMNVLAEPQKAKVSTSVNAYFDKLEKQGLNDLSFSHQKGVSKKWLLLILGFPIFVLGAVLHGLPFLLINMLGRLKGIDIEFRHSIKLGAGLGILIIWYFLLASIAGQYNGWFFPIICILVPILGWLAIRYWEYLSYARTNKSNKHIDADLITAFQQEREALLKKLIEAQLWE